jgi:hypothetical protein
MFCGSRFVPGDCKIVESPHWHQASLQLERLNNGKPTRFGDYGQHFGFTDYAARNRHT